MTRWKIANCQRVASAKIVRSISWCDVMDGQMTIFDYITEPKPKEIGAKCEGCRHKVYLHNGAYTRQACQRYGGCEFSPRDDKTYRRDGTLTDAPDWMKAERCETCRYWEIFAEELQPPDGWGVKGQCNCYHDPETMKNGYWKTGQSSYCQDYERR